ncbi:hypothetical protein [Kineococcus xinjiangensis]|uniref:hypothetical protein n=1 Tax=Kineococcus xinjiangensis TaxID=512762 RepID=UPI000CECC00F|nr:hypothetical protein [Kineococcus xinjiangensis]
MSGCAEVAWTRWLHLTSDPMALAVAPGAVTVAERHTRLVSRDTGTGQEVWSTQGLELRRHVSVCGDVAVLEGWRGYHPMLLQVRTGAEVGRWSLPEPVRHPRRRLRLLAQRRRPIGGSR